MSKPWARWYDCDAWKLTEVAALLDDTRSEPQLRFAAEPAT